MEVILMSELQVFNNAELGSIRTLSINGEPYFVGKDVASVLGYLKPLNALATHIDEDDSLKQGLIDSMGRMQETIFINESGLYTLILSSKLPTAKKFKRWVTSEVLPEIRKHGVYAVDEVLANPDILIQALMQLKQEREINSTLQQTVAVQKQQIIEMKPKASYYDVVLNCKDLVAISVIAKDYGWSANHMNQYLHEKGVQYKQGNKIWLLYQKYAEMGYTNTKTHSYAGTDGTMHTKVHTYWTQQGRLFIYELLKSDGILPTMEQEDGYVD
jgi:prophage antirepressor-like protein